MKLRHYIYKAQSLDNRSPDIFAEGASHAKVTDEEIRQRLSSRISSINRSATVLYEEGSFRLVASNTEFLYQAPSAEKDVAGRAAPMLCCGFYEYAELEDLCGIVNEGMSGFAASIHRSPHSDHLSRTREAFDALKKKATISLRVKGTLRSVINRIAAILSWIWSGRSPPTLPR